MKKRFKRAHLHIIAFAFVVLVATLSLVWFYSSGKISFTGFAVFTQNDQSGFGEGTYSNTGWNGSAVVLSSGQTSGTYTSKVFNATNDANWNNLTKTSNEPNLSKVYTVDGSGAVYYSTDEGATWIQATSGYGGASGTDDITSDNDWNLYIVLDKKIYKSTDYGVTWSIVKDGFSDKNGLLIDADNNDNLFAIDTAGGVWKSSDRGVTWTSQGDFNGGATNDAKGMAINSLNTIYVVDGSGAVYYSSDEGVNWIQATSGYGGGAYTDDIEADSNTNLYILFNKDIYKSIDNGATWDVINYTFTSYAQTGLKMLIDSEDNFIILDEAGRVFKSVDYGISWEEVGDFNGGATNDAKGITEMIQSTNLSFQVRNCSQADCSDASFVDANLSDLSLVSQYFQYQITFTTPDSGTSPTLSSVTVDYDLVNTAPTISIALPNEGDSYGYNESLGLNFSVSDADSNIDSCWYTLDSGITNTTLVSCANTTFDVAEGSHTLTVYVNDTQGEKASDSVSFSVTIGAPTIVLNSPKNVYLTDYNVIFRYIPTDIDLDSCELWGDFTGGFISNQTDISPTSGVENSFSLTLEDGTYKWNIQCNDSVGNSAINGNQTFYIDTINPSLTLSQPTGTKSSRTVSASWVINDASPISCLYNVYRGANIEISNTSVNCSLNSTSFSVTVDADFVFNFYVNDSAGNKNSSLLSFLVDTSSPPPPSSGSPGGSSSITIITKNGTNEITFGQLYNLIAYSGESKSRGLSVKNTGTNFLNNCVFQSIGALSSWVGHTETKNLAAGEEYKFVFDVSVPEVGAGSYTIILSIGCKELSKRTNLVVDVIEKKLNLDLIDVKRAERGKVNVVYSLEELSGIEQDVELQFLLFSGGEKVAEVSETKLISANSKEEFETFIPIDFSVKGEVSLLINLNSEEYSTFLEESVILGAPATGLIILSDGGNIDTFFSIVIILGFLVFMFFIFRKILNHHKKIKKKSRKKA